MGDHKYSFGSGVTCVLSSWAYFLCIEYLVGEYGTEPIADREPRSGRHEAVCHGGKFRQKLTVDVVRLHVEGWLLSIQT